MLKYSCQSCLIQLNIIHGYLSLNMIAYLPWINMFNKEELKKQLAARFACAIGGMVFYIVTNPGRLAWEIANHGSFLEFAIAAILGFFIVDIFTVALIFLMLGTLLEYLLKT